MFLVGTPFFGQNSHPLPATKKKANKNKHLHDDATDIIELSLTAEFDPDEVLDAQIFQEDPRGGLCFKQEGDVCTQLSMEGGEVKVRCLVKERSVPEVV